MQIIAPHTRLRPSPFYESTIAEGVVSFTPYNQMLIPMGYGDPKAEYNRLIHGVSMWDVGGQRQVQITGPDASRLAQILSPRDLSKQQLGQGMYVPMCNHNGTLINDPVVNKLDENFYWFSIADSDVKLWARAIAAERGLDVEITEPDVSPLAVQGPLAETVMALLFGEWVKELKYFWFSRSELNGMPVIVARSGFSKQGGFEIYLMDSKRGSELWNIVREAGKPYGIGPGYPNPCERIESGLLSCGGDSDDTTNPFEVRLGKFINLDVADDVVGIEALRKLSKDPSQRIQLGLVLEGDLPSPNHDRWYEILVNGKHVGHMTNGTWSYRLKKNIGYALISRGCVSGDKVQVIKGDNTVQGVLCELPFC